VLECSCPLTNNGQILYIGWLPIFTARRRGDVTMPRRFSRHCLVVMETRDDSIMTELPGGLSSHRGDSAAIIPW